jgi:hypothetical protein
MRFGTASASRFRNRRDGGFPKNILDCRNSIRFIRQKANVSTLILTGSISLSVRPVAT